MIRRPRGRSLFIYLFNDDHATPICAVSWKSVKTPWCDKNAGLRVDDSRLCTIVGMTIAIPFKLYAVLIFLVFAGVWLALFFTVLNRSQFADTTCATLNGATYRSRRCPRALGISGVRSSRSGPCRTPCQGTACNTFSELSSSSTRRGRRRSLQKVLSRSWSWSPWCHCRSWNPRAGLAL